MGRILREQSQPIDTSDAVASALDAKNLWPQVARAVTQLSAEERDALVLYVWEELSYEQIAIALAVPVGTVRSRLNRARVRVRELNKPCGKQ